MYTLCCAPAGRSPRRVPSQGDASNLIGCLLTAAQLPLTSVTASYFVLCDIIMMVQYTFYATKNRRRELHEASRLKRQMLRHAQEAAEEGLHAYNAANAYTILHPRRHLSGYQGGKWEPSTQVHSVPSAFPSNVSSCAIKEPRFLNAGRCSISGYQGGKRSNCLNYSWQNVHLDILTSLAPLGRVHDLKSVAPAQADVRSLSGHLFHACRSVVPPSRTAFNGIQDQGNP